MLIPVKLDHDRHNSRRLALAEVLRRADRANVQIFSMHERRSASGKGWHRLFWLWTDTTLSASQIVALQLLFGSDPLREAYNFNRARIVDAGALPRYWHEQEAWDVLYTSPYPWRRIGLKLLAAHRERNGDAGTVNARERKKG